MATNASIHQGECMIGLGPGFFLASVVGSLHLLTLFAHVISYTHVYLACILKPLLHPIVHGRMSWLEGKIT